MARTADASTVVVLDGGLSNALEDRGHDLSDDLWSARLLRDDPDEIAAAHRAYFRAGAQVATTASYQASVEGFVRAGAEPDEAVALIRSSVTLARAVRDRADAYDPDPAGPRRVAASIGPYGAVLADGSEYRGRYGLSRSALRDFHGPRLDALVEAGPDLLAVETLPDADEAAVLVELVDQAGVPAWFSYTVAGDVTRAGQPLAEAFAVTAASAQALAVGVNCCAPTDVLPALRVAAGVTELPLVAYPNSGEAWDGARRRWAGTGAFEPALARSWVEAGARYVGGCCRVGPRAIAAVAAALHEERQP